MAEDLATEAETDAQREDTWRVWKVSKMEFDNYWRGTTKENEGAL